MYFRCLDKSSIIDSMDCHKSPSYPIVCGKKMVRYDRIFDVAQSIIYAFEILSFRCAFGYKIED